LFLQYTQIFYTGVETHLGIMFSFDESPPWPLP
jgi:hypothetical protein